MSLEVNTYSGAGVLLVDTNSSSLVLIYDYTLNYNCCGGLINKKETERDSLVVTASREMYEETRTLICCSPTELASFPFVDIVHKAKTRSTLFRCYIYKSNSLDNICQQFQSKDLSKALSEPSYNEVTKLALFPIKQFKNTNSWLTIKQHLKAYDSEGIEKQLNPRCIAVIEEAMKKQLL